MRILFVIEPSGGGSGRHVVDLARALIDGGHAVSVIYSPLRAEPRFEAEISALALTTLERLPLRRAVGPWDINARRALNRLIARLGPFEIVHGHSAKAGALVRLAATPGAARLYTPHALPMMRPSGPLVRLATGVAEAAMTWIRCDALIAVSEAEIATARGWGLPKGRLHLVPNGVALAPSTDRPAARSALGVADDALVVGFVGRMCPQKDPLRFVQAVRLAQAADPRILGVVIGDGPLMARARAAAGDAVRIIGQRDARPLMTGFDLFAMTSRYEAGAYAMIEAAALGLPIVTTDVGGVDALLDAGARIDRLPNDAEPVQLAQAMVAALAARGPRQAVSMPSLSVERMAEQTLAVYRAAFARRRLGA
ncbi:MAG: glycosyltransferase family 4 protein [Brevundimonas sp.]|uniref:glycosyltransferase family 4 protein n=1 Tax=Brevundimonas sp. TaxID=1871086 RepID=UPI0028CFE2EC|nr:glycosyltransferase family 4 protein [uncultured Brevundimonas sp.]